MAKESSQIHDSITEIDPTPTPRSTEKDPLNAAGSQIPPKAERWHVSFATQFWIVVLLFFGIVFTLAHHFYYLSLNGQSTAETSQEWAIRIGTGLSVLAKASLIASAAMSYQQHYWTILRERPISVRGIDDIMGLLANPAGFFNWEVLRHAWSCVVIAFFIWCIPLSTLVPPASLSAAISVTEHTNVSNVPIVAWNGVQFAVTGGRGEFADAGQTTYRVVTAAAYAGSILPMPALYQNYSYEMSFPGPRLRCGEVQNQTLFNSIHLNGLYRFEEGIVNGKIAYNATNRGSGIDAMRSPIPASNQYDVFFLTPTKNFTCETWNVTYSAKFSFVNGAQKIDVTKIRYDSHFAPNVTGYYACPTDNCAYKGWYKAVSDMLIGEAYTHGAYEMFTGTARLLQTNLIGCPEMGLAANLSGISGVACPAENLMSAVEALSENATMSFFSAMPAVYWRNRLDDYTYPTSNITGANYTTVPIETTISETRLVHSYNMRSLLISYSAAILVAIIILLVGFRALWHNGISHASTFSGILCTTRNRDLDHWAQGHCLGLEHSLKEVSRQKLQFGILLESDGRELTSGNVRHAAFGYEDKVMRLRKGDKCI
ncbi:hypothetical protein ACN47E_007204 [Coniothyrium glycines]